MIDMVIETKTLPLHLLKRIYTKTVKVHEEKGKFVITPIKEENVNCPLLGMFSDGKVSSVKFIAQKQKEKKLEI